MDLLPPVLRLAWSQDWQAIKIETEQTQEWFLVRLKTDNHPLISQVATNPAMFCVVSLATFSQLGYKHMFISYKLQQQLALQMVG